MKQCEWCSDDVNKVSHTGKCPKVKAIEYHGNGTVKRVEFFDEFRAIPYPYPYPTTTEPQPPYKITIGDNSTQSWSNNVAWFQA